MLDYVFKTSVMIALIVSLMWSSSMAMGPVQEGGVKGLSERVEKVENALKELGIRFSGAIEVEAAYTSDDRTDADSSDITLATVEVGLDVNPIEHVGGHILFLFEEGDTDPIDVDEAYVRLDGTDKLPLYLNAGRQYLPFGYFESHFISDPLTLELGETRESALVFGFANDTFDVAAGLFNGDVNETGEQDDHIDGYVISAAYTLPTNKYVGLMTGISYISNIGESDTLQGEDGIDVDAGNTIDSVVPGLAVFVSATFMEKLQLELEYVAAVDEFESGQLGFDSGEAAKPIAYNVELAYLIKKDLEAAIRLAGAEDAGAFLPEFQYGVVVNYGLFNGVSLGLEYQYGEFDTPDKDGLSTLTAQLALAF